MQQFNPFRFYTNKLARQWDKTPEEGTAFVFFQTGIVPKFAINLPVGEVPPSFTGKLYNTNEEEIYSLAATGISVQDGYAHFTFSGDTLVDEPEANCYFDIVIGTTHYYSDVFVWKDDVSELLKFEVGSSQMASFNNYIYMFYGQLNTFYLNAEYLGLKPKIEQEGTNNRGITEISYGTRIAYREFQLDLNESIYLYLSALGLVKSNGVVYLTYGYETWNATEITFEEVENFIDGIYQIKMSFADKDEAISMVN